MKHFYVKFDMTAKKSNPGHGFANTKRYLAFESKKKAISFCEERKAFDFSCKLVKASEITKEQARYAREEEKNAYEFDLYQKGQIELNFKKA